MRKLSGQELIEYLPKYGLSATAEDYVIETLSTEASRKVGQFARSNVSGNYSSPSQGLTVQYESHTAELSWLVRWELDEDVIGFRDQPPAIDLRKADKNGVERLSRYTADFLVFRSESISIVEVKPVEEIEKLSLKYPEQWQFHENAWIYVPAKDAFERKGLTHEVCCLSAGHSIETSNIKLLIQAHRSQAQVDPEVASKIKALLESTAWISIAELRKRIPAATNIDVYQLILNRDLFANIKTQLLSEAESCDVSSDKDTLVIKEAHEWSAPKSLDAIDASKVPDKAEWKNALRRLDRVNSNDGSRHSRRLKKKIAEAEGKGLSPVQALILPRRGSTKSKLPDLVRLSLVEHIRTYYMSSKRPSVYSSWTNYRNWARDRHPGSAPVSRNTYAKYIEFQNQENVAFSRGGKRAGNAASATAEVSTRGLRAIRPLERGSIDHALLKLLVKVVESNGNTYTRRPHLTVLMDDYSGCWLSFFLTFNAPSKRSLSMLFRSCIREYGKLPETIHSDRGSDFRSTYYDALLAHYQINSGRSPAGHSRFNSQVERINKQVKDQWIAERAGNTIDYLETRKFSKNHRPQDLAEISLDDLFVEIESFKNHYNQTVVGTELVSPQQLFTQGLEQFSFSGIPILEDEEFLLVTAYDTRHSEYKIGPKGEVVYNELHFYNPVLRQQRPKRAHTELRIDPEDPYRIYCKVGSEWITALNSRHTKFSSQTCLTRWAEAVRIAEGRPLRDEAKQDANDIKAKAAQEFDDQYRQAELEASSNIEDEANGSFEPVDLFERLKIKTLSDLDVESS